MNDEYIEELHKIREISYEETKNMAPAELIEYFHSSHQWFEQQVAESRVRKTNENQTIASELVIR